MNPDSRDIAFLVDVSSSICSGSDYDMDGECDNFKLQETFIESLMTTLLDETSTTGMISWATTVQELYPFMVHVGVDENVNAMRENLQYEMGATMTGAMLQRYIDFLSADQGQLGQAGRDQAVVMITDGISTDNVCDYASEFQSALQGKNEMNKNFIWDAQLIVVTVGIDGPEIMSRFSCIQPDETKFIMVDSFGVS